MEFPFGVNRLFKEPITKIYNNLLPEGFQGDRRSAGEVSSKIAEVITALGEASAGAQGLSKPITTSNRIRLNDHNLYVLTDPTGKNGQGCVLGLCKTGHKMLFLFDESGRHHQMSPTCLLDFYVHESHRRKGHGRRLFEYMLKDEGISPVALAVDRPSFTLLSFLNKHYGLSRTLPQSNNYVVFDGFFEALPGTDPTVQRTSPHHVSPKKPPSAVSMTETVRSPGKCHLRANGLQDEPPILPRPPLSPIPIGATASEKQPHYGRYGAPKPYSSIGQIIHQSPPGPVVLREPGNVNNSCQSEVEPHWKSQENVNDSQNVPPIKKKLERPKSLFIPSNKSTRSLFENYTENQNGGILQNGGPLQNGGMQHNRSADVSNHNIENDIFNNRNCFSENRKPTAHSYNSDQNYRPYSAQHLGKKSNYDNVNLSCKTLAQTNIPSHEYFDNNLNEPAKLKQYEVYHTEEQHKSACAMEANGDGNNFMQKKCIGTDRKDIKYHHSQLW